MDNQNTNPETPPVPPTSEELAQRKKQQRDLDFILGANTQHLRLPQGLPKEK